MLKAGLRPRHWGTALAVAFALLPGGSAWASPKSSAPEGCSPAPPPLRIEEPERDLSEVERIVGEVKGLTMGSICGPLTRFDFDSLPGAFTPGARVQQFLPRDETPVVHGRGNQGGLAQTAPGCYGTARDLQADLRSLMDDWVRVERCFFKPFRIFATREEPRRAVADLHFWLGGSVRGGGRVSEKGDVTAELEQDASGKWRFTRLEFGQRELFRSETPAFSDWTERAKLPTAWEDQGYDTTDIAFGQILYGGVAAGDYDGDGWTDLYISRAGENLLLRNRNGNGFEDVTRQAGVGDPGNSQAALFVDLDNDGDLDLFVVNALYSLIKGEHSHRGHVTYRNEGGGRFARLAGELGPLGPASGVTAADYDRDGLLDLYVTYYQDAKLNPYHHYVEARDGFGNRLYRNLGGLKFEDVTGQAGVGGNGWSYASAWADFDADGRIDLFVANDFGDDHLYRNRGDGSFEQVAARAGVADPANGMAADWGDYDNDGKLDLYIANMYSKTGNQFVPLYPELSDTLRQKLLWSARGNSLYRNRGDGGFEETAVKAAVNLAGWAWGSNFFDYDNDGWLDLHIANGFWAGPTEDDA